MALPQSQGLALATALDLATTSNGGLNSQLLSYSLTLGSCRSPGQGLNLLPPVTFVQEEEKVEEEEATQEVTQQR